MLFTNHAYVLAELARDPDLRLREVADRTGITERSAQRIVRELEAAGYLRIERSGWRNRYLVGAGSASDGDEQRESPLPQLTRILDAAPAGRGPERSPDVRPAPTPMRPTRDELQPRARRKVEGP